ncbi:sensor histidine kinase [Actinoalloteichus caeruleus]|uniref:sensor histidine kinase n=1 Tax=Actinoalloteichus cyanogriseus TaxID=2893586 RepID=UPI0004AA5DD2|nr:histidine kinase [Actinoalloteichus caeruleus]
MDFADRPVLRSRAWLIAAGLLLAIALTLTTVGVDPPRRTVHVAAVAVGAALVVVWWAVRRFRRQRREHEEELTAWAAERAAQAERLRIARDLHDLASHGLGLITVRAASARSVVGPDGEAERAAALVDIERAGRQATTELRRMLSVLRGPGDEVPSRPQDTVRDLPGIVEAARASGVTATLEFADMHPLSEGLELTLCAVVREALANTARHAGPVRAHVVVRGDGDGDGVTVTISNPGASPDWTPQPGAGRGLLGLRERVTALGGTLHTQHTERGFRLTAHLPERKDQ